MKKRAFKCLCLSLAAALLLGLSAPALAVSDQVLDAAVEDTASYLYHLVKSPQIGSIGGEWVILGLARSGYSVPDAYYQDYYQVVEQTVKDCQGVLSTKKYTEYSRVIVALASIGKDARNVGGYDLTQPLGDYDKTIWQGINGPIWALIALDSRNYPMPQNSAAKTQATRQMYIDRILSCELPDGGWSLLSGSSSADADSASDPDITGMALQALAKYQDQAKVKTATAKALAWLSAQQSNDGGFTSQSTSNVESSVQVLVALDELGLSMSDSRFVKNGNSLVDNILSFYNKGAGFHHTVGGSNTNQMATEQALYALVAAQRAQKGKNSLYRMSDAISVGASGASVLVTGAGLEGKNADVKAPSVVSAGITFADIKSHKNQSAIEALASRNILKGVTDTSFSPNATMTRAQFAAVVVRALGLTPKAVTQFTDVKSTDWCAGYVGTAFTYGIVNGTTTTTFAPEGAITRQQAAVMIARAAKLCGMETGYDTAASRDVLAQFGDYRKCAAFAWPSLAFCYDKRILDSNDLNIRPGDSILRCEVSQMVYNLLSQANLL